MALFEASQVLSPLSEDSPCGDNPEYGADFQRLEEAARGREESQFAEAEEPDWREVENLALTVLESSRDLRVLIYLAQAQLARGDWASFAEAMQAVAGLLQNFWDCVHPQLDPDDGDPTERINAVSSMSHASTLLGELRKAPLIDAKGVGRFSVRDVATALGKMETREGETSPDMSLITAAISSIDPSEIERLYSQVAAAKEALNAGSRAFAERLSASDTPDIEPVLHLLEIVDGFLAPLLSQEEAGGEERDAPDSGAETSRPAAAGQSGEIRGRDDVVRWIDKICDYYKKNEPSSPVPILLRRAKGLVHKSFAEIIADLVPSASSEFHVFEGSQDSGGDAESGEADANSGW